MIVDSTVQESVGEIEIIKEYFPNTSISDRLFDLILGCSVLGHMSDPILFLNDIKKHLTSDSMVMLVYPDCEAQMLRGDINVIIQEHLSYFTETSSRC